VSSVEHLLVAEAGTDERSRYVLMVGVRVEDPQAVAERLTDVGDDQILAVLRQVAFEIRIAFASKQRLQALGEDWQYSFLGQLTQHSFNPDRHRARGYPLVVHLPEGLRFDLDWLDAYLTNTTYGGARVQTRVVARDERILLLPQLVARIFCDAIEDDIGRPSVARDRYEALESVVSHIEDVGLNISYFRGGTTMDDIIRASLSN
jgi:hypothetical protein